MCQVFRSASSCCLVSAEKGAFDRNVLVSLVFEALLKLWQSQAKLRLPTLPFALFTHASERLTESPDFP